MIALKPVPYNLFDCPECGAAQPLVNEVRFESIQVWAACTCKQCALEFYHTLPVGHTVAYSLAIGKGNDKVYQHHRNPSWLSNALLKSHIHYQTKEIGIQKVVHKTCRNVVILNTLDSLYGHVLLKLYNAFYHLDHQKELGLVLIIPKMFEWLVPKGCAEVWVVDLKLNEFVFGYESIQKFVAEESLRFSEIYLSNAYSHPDFTSISAERLTGVVPFDLANFTRQPPTVTFVLREDRWWLSSVLDYWFYRVSRKLNILKWTSLRLSRKQNRLVKQTISEIKRHLPETVFHIVGLGNTGRFVGYATDERKWEITESVEKSWCETYAKSQVVVGVHGSNMLLPTALAAGCVEILPDDRYGNMVQDISVRYNSRLQLFFYRFADQYASPASVAKKVVSMLKDYEGYHANMCRHVYDTELAMTTL